MDYINVEPRVQSCFSGGSNWNFYVFIACLVCVVILIGLMFYYVTRKKEEPIPPKVVQAPFFAGRPQYATSVPQPPTPQPAAAPQPAASPQPAPAPPVAPRSQPAEETILETANPPDTSFDDEEVHKAAYDNMIEEIDTEAAAGIRHELANNDFPYDEE